MKATAEDLFRLRSQLEARFGSAILPAGIPAPAREERAGFRFRVAGLDRLLPGGVPRGALSLWVGEATSGRTAALRALVEQACGEGATVGVVDAGLTLDASFGSTGEAELPGLWVVRPPEAGREAEGAWAAEALLRSGVFDLLVLDGHAPDSASAYRLRGLAREHEVALVVSAELEAGSMGWRADLRLEFRRTPALTGGGEGLLPGGRFRRRARLSVGGGEREVELVYEPADRLRPGAPAADRRPRAR